MRNGGLRGASSRGCGLRLALTALALLSGCSVGIDDPDPLMNAVSSGRTAQVQRLVAAGSDPNELYLGRGPLHEAAVEGDARMVQVLLDVGADPDLAGDDDWVPLHSAALRGRLGVARLLLQAGADACRVSRSRVFPGRPSAVAVQEPTFESQLPEGVTLPGPAPRRAETAALLRQAEEGC